ncbi:DUF2889 domain-containing protein [Desulfoscipio gibsoniae]
MINVIQRHWLTTVRFDSPPPGNEAKVNTDATVITEHQREHAHLNSAQAAELDAFRQQKTGYINAQTVYCGTDCEISTRLQVDPISFKIMDAAWENHSPPVAITNVPGMRGIEAYFNCGPAIKEALAGLGPFLRALFSETIRGIIQAETFLFKERGFASASDYSKYWEKFYANSCRYYSNLDKVSQSWDDYACYMRSGNLFNRFKSYSVYATPDFSYHVIATFSDSFHELSIELDIEKNMVITGAGGTLLRAPDKICKEAAVFLQQLPGHTTTSLSKKQVAALLGKGNGCVHIIDTVYDALASVGMAANRHAG